MEMRDPGESLDMLPIFNGVQPLRRRLRSELATVIVLIKSSYFATVMVPANKVLPVQHL